MFFGLIKSYDNVSGTGTIYYPELKKLVPFDIIDTEMSEQSMRRIKVDQDVDFSINLDGSVKKMVVY